MKDLTRKLKKKKVTVKLTFLAYNLTDQYIYIRVNGPNIYIYIFFYINCILAVLEKLLLVIWSSVVLLYIKTTVGILIVFTFKVQST